MKEETFMFMQFVLRQNEAVESHPRIPVLSPKFSTAPSVIPGLCVFPVSLSAVVTNNTTVAWMSFLPSKKKSEVMSCAEGKLVFIHKTESPDPPREFAKASAIP